MGQKFFDIHESSRFNMSFKCSGEFNIIYIMRTNIRRAIGKYIEVWHYPDGHKELRLNGVLLPYSTVGGGPRRNC